MKPYKTHGTIRGQGRAFGHHMVEGVTRTKQSHFLSVRHRVQPVPTAVTLVGARLGVSKNQGAILDVLVETPRHRTQNYWVNLQWRSKSSL